MNKINLSRWLTLTCLAVALVTTACTPSQKPQTEEDAVKPTIKLGENPWTTAALNTAVAKVILEDEMGYPVEVVAIDENAQWAALANGDLHASLEVWPSGHADNFALYIEEQASVEIGGLLGPVGAIGWFMPRYMLEEHPELATWEGFQDPKVAALFSTSATGAKGQLLLGDPSWVYVGPEFIESQKLPLQPVYAGSEDAILLALDKAYSEKKPILFYLWTPHTAFAKYQLVEVKLPEYTQQCEDKATAGNGRDCGYPPDVLLKVLSASLSDYAPEAYRFLKNFKYTSEDQIMMLGLVDIQGKTIEEAAHIWVDQNENIWRAWIP